LAASDDSAVGAENLETLEDTPIEEAPTADPEPLSMAEGSGMGDLDLSDEPTGHEAHAALSEDDLLLDMNAVEDAHKKH
jgi:hypothetical protein